MHTSKSFVRCAALVAVPVLALSACSTGSDSGGTSEGAGSGDNPVTLESADRAGTLADYPKTDQGQPDPRQAVYYSSLKGKKIAFVPNAMKTDLATAWAQALRDEFEPLGAEILTRDPAFDTNAGAQAITQLIGQKPDVIVVQNPDVTSWATPIKQAQDAGIYVVQMNMGSQQTSDVFIGADYVNIGRLLGEQLVDRCGKSTSGKVAIVQGPLTASAGLYMTQGIYSVLNEHPEIKVVSDQAADWDASKANAVTTTVLKQHADLCGIAGYWDGMDGGTAEAVKQAGLQDKVFMITTSGAWQTLGCNLIANGSYDAMVVSHAKEQGQQLATVVKALLQQRPAVGSWNMQIYTKSHVVTKANLQSDSCWSTAELG
jgi:ribose transport system substrate-binding protein